MAMVLTVCHDTPSSAAIAEMVVRSIINRRNIYRAHRRVVDQPGRASRDVLIEHRPPTRWHCTAVTGHPYPQHQRVTHHRQIGHARITVSR